MSPRQLGLVLLAIGVTSPVHGQIAQTPVDGVDLFEEQVLPILESNCFACHGNPERAKGELVLATRGGLLRGGAHGPAIDANDPNQSLILHALSYTDEQLEMPPSGRLEDAEIEAITQWVQLGAPYGGEEDSLTTIAADDTYTIDPKEREFWSVKPLRRPERPKTNDSNWAEKGIDRFVLAGLEEKGLEPSTRADRRTLIRRASYDLTGLPPSAEEVEDFEQDPRPDAFERLIDRLLASPQYGEKWGRHWLDLVRFAETMGYERDSLKPGAWRYRDWVIEALNADMPYNEFLVHQLAGDEIEQPTLASIIATGYLRLAIWDDEPTDVALAQYDDLDSILDTTSRVMLGMSIGCARCHNHRGDPIPQRDYYRMLSFFRGIAPYKVGGGNAPTPENYFERVPKDYGEPNRDAELARWQAERALTLSGLESLVIATRDAASLERLAEIETSRNAGLVTHLAFEEQAPLVAEDSTGKHHGRIESATVGIPGRIGNAYSFDGENDSVRVERRIARDFTISLWFRTATKAPGIDLFWYNGSGLVHGNAVGDENDFGLSMVGDGHIVAGTGNPMTVVASDPGYDDGEWHHVVLTRELASGALELYIDGDLVSQATGSTEALDAAPFLEIGKLQAVSGRSGHFVGDLDEVRLYERTLDHREVLDLFVGGGATAAFADLVAEHRPADASRHEQLLAQLLATPRPRREYLEVLRVKEVGPRAPPTHVLIRGNPHAPTERVEPGFPIILDDRAPDLPERGPNDQTTGRRLTLARWIASDENSRTPRVIANRLWQFHFGRGLVPTPNDFGHFGREPTHPLLLDWLAVELVERGWSLKAMHRLIMTSQAYQMASTGRPEALAADPENNLLWRFDMRRLTAEEIRDSILAATGTLNLEQGGPGVYPPLPEEVLATSSTPDEVWGESTPDQAARRSIYIHAKRSLRHPLLDTLDLADTDATCPVRFVTTQPTQALTLLNSDFMNQQAALLAERAKRDVGRKLEKRVARALRIVLSRQPHPWEVEQGMGMVEDLERKEGFSEQAAFDSYCLLLLNLNEFVYLD